MSITSIRNVTVRIERPNHDGPGGDPVGGPTVIATIEPGHLVATDKLVRRADGREVEITGILRMNELRLDRDPQDVLEGDWVTYTNHLGTVVADREVVSVKPYVAGCETDHIEVSLGR